MCHLCKKNISKPYVATSHSFLCIHIDYSILSSLFTADSWPGGTLLKLYLQQILPSKAQQKSPHTNKHVVVC